MHLRLIVSTAVICAALALFGTGARAAETIVGDAGTYEGGASVGLAATATFLQASGAGATDALAIDLAALDIHPGDLVTLSDIGFYSPGPGQPDSQNGLLGVFSSSNVLLGASILQRVPGAIGTGTPVNTGANDIPQDFAFDGAANPVSVTVPTGANYLFFGVNDPTPGDNTDPDHNLIVNVGIPALNGLIVGGAHSGAISIDGGTSVSTHTLDIAGAYGIPGQVTVSGSASALQVQANIHVGSAGDGTMRVERGGVVTQISPDQTVFVANTAGANGDLVVTDPGSRMDVAGSIVVGGGVVFTPESDGTPYYYGIVGGTGTGSVEVLAGGHLSASGVTFGASGGPTAADPDNGYGVGTGLVDGSGSRLNVTGDNAAVVVGSQGVGTLTVQNGGSVVTAGTDSGVYVGAGSGGTGTLTVQSGGSVDTLNLETGLSGTGTTTITGAGSQVVVSNDNGHFSAPYQNEGGFVRVGRDAGSTGTLNVLDGGQLTIRATTTESGPGLQVGRYAGSTGHVTVNGAGSRIDISQTAPATAFDGGPFVVVGHGGSGDLTVSGGGVVALSGDQAVVNIAREATATGSVHVTGSGSTLSVSGADSYMNVGTRGNGSLVIDNGGVVDPTYMAVGRDAGSTGTVSVSGAGSKLELSGDGTATNNYTGAFVDIGRAGTGTVTVSNGASFVISADQGTYPGVWLGRDATGTGTLTLSGAGTSMTVSGHATAPAGTFDDGYSGWIAIGGAGTGTMTVADGASASNDPNGTTLVGGYAPGGAPVGSGTLTVRGAGSKFNAGKRLMIAADPYGSTDPWGYGVDAESSGGTGTVMVGAGAVLDAQEVYIGNGGVLGGSGGTVNGDVIAFDGGVVAPGASPGDIFVTGGLDLSAGGILDLQIAGTGTGQYDRIFIGGPLDLAGGTIRISLLGGTLPDILSSFDIGDFLYIGTDPTTATGLSDYALLGGVNFTGLLSGGGSFNLAFDSTTSGFSVLASTSSVPEPDVLLLVATGLVVLLMMRVVCGVRMCHRT